jgi:hypothetical protein
MHISLMGEMGNAYKMLLGKTGGKRHLRVGSIILKWCALGSSPQEDGGCYESGNETSDSPKRWGGGFFTEELCSMKLVLCSQ